MSDSKDENGQTLKLGGPKRLQLNKTVAAGQVKQSFSHGRTNTVKVEKRRKRVFERGAAGDMNAVAAETAQPGGAPVSSAAVTAKPVATPLPPVPAPAIDDGLSEAERRNRMRALASATAAEQSRLREMEEAEQRQAARRRAEQEEEARRQAEAETRRRAEEEAERARAREQLAEERRRESPAPEAGDDDERGQKSHRGRTVEKEKKAVEKKPAAARGRDDARRRKGKLTISQALEQDGGDTRVRSLAAFRRAKEKERQRAMERRGRHEKIARDVVIPESITVSDLANRMAERIGDTIKAFMKMGMMVTQNQVLDADVAELVATELGHRVRRVAESDVEIGIHGDSDRPEDLQPRPPVVAVMGHVDHGKTSLLDALRHTDVAAGEAGGITQHIGAYQVTLASGNKITFLDTPGHAAFTQMRMRGATVTDLVVLVVAADDGIQPQTREAVSHARAAGTPIIVAINKCDRPEADPARVRSQLLELELVPEALGGDVLCIEVSALKKQNLDKLEEAILLQAEMLELAANPDRHAAGTVVEARLEKGRGTVATLLVQQGTLRVGDMVVAGAEWGRVRALLDDRGRAIDAAGPSVPVEILGLQGAPRAGDDFVVPADEAKAREVADYRQRKLREKELQMANRGSLEQMFDRISAGEAKELAVVIKADVQGSLEAIVTALEKLSGEEVKVRILHGAVGGVTESDISLAASTGGLAVGFNVRANPQARDMARRDGVDIRYYSVIYDLIADVKGVLDGMLAPEEREKILGYAEIREVFSVSKFGKAAGCMVTEGVVRRGGRVRLLRDDVVVHEGTLKTLRRFKEDVREVKQGFECGMSFENYQDIRNGDRVECFEIEQLARTA